MSIGTQSIARAIHSATPRGRLQALGLVTIAAISLTIPAHAKQPNWDDGYWFRYTTPAREGHTAVFDPIRDRMIILSGGTYENFLDDIWAFSFGSHTWTRLDSPATRLPKLDGATALFDPDQNRLIIFNSQLGGDIVDVALTGTPGWSRIAGPDARVGFSQVFDPMRKRVLVFGGYLASGFSNDVLALNLAQPPTWERLSTTGALPKERAGATLVYDQNRDALIMFGGIGPSEDPFAPPQARSDVWSLSLATLEWSRLSPGGPTPPAAVQEPGVFSAANDQMILFAPASAGGSYALTFSPSLEWVSMPAVPNNTVRFSVILDTTREAAVVFGGRAEDGRFGDLWSFDLHARQWSPISYATPKTPVYFVGNLVYDPARDRFLLLASLDYGSTPELWAFSPSAQNWVQVDVAAGSRPAFAYGNFYYDALRDRLIAYGAHYESGSTLPDYQLWDLTLEGTPAWRRVGISGVAHPPPSSVLTLDPLRNRLIGFYGGLGLWELPLDGIAQWDSIMVTGMPPMVGSPPSITTGPTAYDPREDRLIMSGGRLGGSFQPTEIGSWALDLSPSPSWTMLVPPGAQPWQALNHAVYDPIRNRIVAHAANNRFGGIDNETAVLDLAGAWRYLSPDGRLSNEAYALPAQAYDPVRDQLFVFRSDGPGWALVWGTPAYPQASTTADTTWAPGDTLAISMTLSNPLAFSQDVVCSVADTRAWPGLPLTQTVLVTAGGEQVVSFRLAVPDTAAAGANPIRVAAVFKQTSIRQGQGYALRSATPPVVLVPLGTAADSGHVRLRWSGSPLVSEAYVERQESGSDWRELGRATRGLDGAFTFEDDSVLAGAEYGYRLRYLLGSRVRYTAETHVRVPSLVLVLLGAAADSGHVRLKWSGSPLVSEAYVEREESGSGWRELGRAARNLDGAFTFEDDSTVAGSEYLYRLRYLLGGRVQYSAETRVRVPMSTPAPPPPTFSLSWAGPNPGPDLSLRISLPDDRPCRLRVFDLQGRVVQSRELGALGPGEHPVTVREGRIRSGIYVVRLDRPGRQLSLRAVVVR